MAIEHVTVISFTVRLQNRPYFWVDKYARAVKKQVCNEAENTDFFTDFEKKTDCFAVYFPVGLITYNGS